VILALHVAAGSIALVAGPVAYLVAGRRRAPLRVYLVAVLGVAATALGLVAADPDGLWWLAPLALLTAALAALGRWGGATGGSAAARAAAHGWGGSYIALVTALLVVSVSTGVLVWVMPTIVGVVLIELHARRATRVTAATTTAPGRTVSPDRSAGTGDPWLKSSTSKT